MFKLGTKLRDTVTGFTGIATARAEYLNGCVQYGLAPPVDKDGKMVEAQYFDYQRLEAVDTDGPAVKSSNTGGPQRDVPAATYRG